jgi:hypothetical protein
MYSESPELALLVMSSSRDPHRGLDLISEIERYLRVVETFRREGCEPHWAREEARSFPIASEAHEPAPGPRC